MHSRVLGAFFEEQHYIILYWGSDEWPEEMDSAVPRSEPLFHTRIKRPSNTCIRHRFPVFLILDFFRLYRAVRTFNTSLP